MYSRELALMRGRGPPGGTASTQRGTASPSRGGEESGMFMHISAMAVPVG